MTIRRSIEDVIQQGEHERIADSIFSDAQGRIVDRDTFDQAYKNFMSETGDITQPQEQLGQVVFQKMREKHPTISNRRIFTKAGGKDLKRDQQKTAKVVVTDRQEFIRRGAQRTDLQGLDTRRPSKEFSFIGQRRDGKIVRAREVIIIVNGKEQTRFRDTTGRFVSRKTE